MYVPTFRSASLHTNRNVVSEPNGVTRARENLWTSLPLKRTFVLDVQVVTMPATPLLSEMIRARKPAMLSTFCPVVCGLIASLYTSFLLSNVAGLINPECTAFIGSGVVVHVPSLFNELDTLERKGLKVAGRLFVSDRAHLVMGFHQIVDGLKEVELGGSSIGTTRKGIGPAYSSKASRSGLRVHHLFDPTFPAKFRKLVEGRFKRYGHFEFDTEGEIEMYLVSSKMCIR